MSVTTFQPTWLNFAVELNVPQYCSKNLNTRNAIMFNLAFIKNTKHTLYSNDTSVDVELDRRRTLSAH
jgi:hypothetical protein